MRKSRQGAGTSPDTDYAPPSFENAAGQRVVFVDFLQAAYNITFDVAQQSAYAESEIRFVAAEEGFPAFDLLVEPNMVEIDGQPTNAVHQFSPDEATRFRRLTTSLSAGEHVLKVTHQIPGGAQMTGEGVRWYGRPPRVSCMFSMTDLNRDDATPEIGGFLERYLPSNLEYDHFAMRFDVKVVNSSQSHRLFTNVAVSGDHRWRFELPPYYSSSCPWFHLVPERDIGVATDTLESVDGRHIPLTVYALRQGGWRNTLDQFMQETRRALAELEGRHGAFPHPQVTIFAMGNGGGMEYSGATRTEFRALEHELNHSYFARNIVPANGDAGWIDEAIASWGDQGNPASPNPPSRTANLGNRSPYRRRTHYGGYTQGRDFISYLNFLCQDVGGIQAVLTEYLALKSQQSVTSAEFQRIVEAKAGKSLKTEFDTYVFGRGAGPLAGMDAIEEDASHPHAVPNAAMADEFFAREDA